nr:zinc finger, CCHC-type [Tanacetum cinerariifolium]
MKWKLSQEKLSQEEVMGELNETFDNIIDKLSQDHVEMPNEAVEQRMNDHVHDEIDGVIYDTNIDASISGKEELSNGKGTLESSRGMLLNDDLSLKDLGKHLLIEEQYRLENKANNDTSKVHLVEEKGESSKLVRRLSRLTSSLGKEHWDAVNRVFKYLKKTMEYNEDPSVLEGYTNASWITAQEDYASMSRWIFEWIRQSIEDVAMIDEIVIFELETFTGFSQGFVFIFLGICLGQDVCNV